MSNNLDRPTSVENNQGPIKVSNVMKEDFGFEIAIESVPLPSRGVIYSQEGPLFEKETLDIKPMTAKEEDILTSRAYIKNGTVLTKLMQSCLVNKNINPDDLISGSVWVGFAVDLAPPPLSIHLYKLYWSVIT